MSFRPVEKIDLHVHTSESKWFSGSAEARYATPEELLAIYETIGVGRGVLLPEIAVEGGFVLSSNYEIWQVVQKYPDHFSWFCNVDPRQGTNSPETDFRPFLRQCMAFGAKGLGEMCYNLPFTDPMCRNLFRQLGELGLSAIFHIGNPGGDYGVVDSLGLPGLERTLADFPDFCLIGHSQKFWAEISGDVTESVRDGYPTGKVVPGGRLPELMRTYPNLRADLSAGSGYNALARDPEHAWEFLEEFQDRLYFGTDICDPRNITSPMLKLSAFLDDACANGRISREAYYKISRGNAEKLLGLEPAGFDD